MLHECTWRMVAVRISLKLYSSSQDFVSSLTGQIARENRFREKGLLKPAMVSAQIQMIQELISLGQEQTRGETVRLSVCQFLGALSPASTTPIFSQSSDAMRSGESRRTQKGVRFDWRALEVFYGFFPCSIRVKISGSLNR